MAADSLGELNSEFETWRNTRRNIREPVPEGLIIRARRAAQVHGVSSVVAATKLARRHLPVSSRCTGKRRIVPVKKVPAFSRIELTAPPRTNQPVAEVEMPSGMKLRIFAVTAETTGLLSALCGVAGAR